MRNFIAYFIVLVTLLSCGNDATTMNVKGTIKGLKKGTLYLQKIEDTALVVVDSIVINGKSDFAFSTTLESPEVFYLYLNKKDGNELNDRILFFGEPGEITITTSRENFEVDAKIEGSETHKVWEQYSKGKSRYTNQNLDLIKATFEAQRDSNLVALDSLNKLAEKNTLRSYLYTINFVLNNSNSHVAPYIVMAEAYDMQVKYLDTIHKALTPEVANSKYGKMLTEFINKVKQKESNSK